MLKEIIGSGVRVRVVKEERVIPLQSSGRDQLEEVVRTTTEWGRERIRWRREVEIAGSGLLGAEGLFEDSVALEGVSKSLGRGLGVVDGCGFDWRRGGEEWNDRRENLV